MKTTSTYVLTSGKEFSIEIKGHPTLHHNGSLSIWTVHLNKSEQSYLETYLLQIEQPFNLHKNEPTSEEKRLHKRRNNTEQVFHCFQCPKCVWFDLSLPNQCGVMDYHPSVVSEMIADRDSRSSKDFHTCEVFDKEQGGFTRK